MNAKEAEYVHDAMRMLDANLTQCMRLQRKIMHFLKEQNAQNRGDLDFEINVLRKLHQPSDPKKP
jgi:hypothetical protein